MTANTRAKIQYIYDLPYSERTKLCRILDLNGKWEELGGKHMQFSMMDILALRQEFLRYNSPTDELLTKWGHMNHTVDELFVLLSKMHHYQAMLILKPFVDSKYHRLLHEGEANLSQSFFSDKDCSTKTDISTSSSHQPSTSGARELRLQSVAGALLSDIQNDGLSLNKNLDVGQHNLNVDKSPGRALPLNKVDFPEKIEEKILNVPGNKENNHRKLSNCSDVSGTSEWTGTIPLIAYKELLKATQNWDKHCILGKGGFGTVYKGTWKNTQVAIKKIDIKGQEGSAENYHDQMVQSLRELPILNSCRHDNILPVYGYSTDGEEPCLVYQFMPNGSLEDRLLCRRGSKPLTWLQRHNIAEGTARGLQFLHNNDTPFIHGDIKSANILLDSNLEPRIGDFGLAREGPLGNYTHMKVSRVHGTKPYLPDEYLRSYQLSPKVDTYSFGVVLFELATGLRAYDETRPADKYLKEYVDRFQDSQLSVIMDKKGGSEDQHTFTHLIQLGKLCVSRLAKGRPGMEVVLKELENIATKREMTLKAQAEIRKPVPNPSTPYGLQVLYEQMKNMQPGAHANGLPSASAGVPAELNNNTQSPQNAFIHNLNQQPSNGRFQAAGNRFSNAPLLSIPPGVSRSQNTSPTSNNSPRHSPNPPFQPTTPPNIVYSPPSDTSQTESYTTSDDSDDSMTASNCYQAHQNQVPEFPPDDVADVLPMLTELLDQPDSSETTSSRTPTAKSKTFTFHDDH